MNVLKALLIDLDFYKIIKFFLSRAAANVKDEQADRVKVLTMERSRS